MERAKNHLNGWSLNSLSLAGRVTLVDSVVTAIPSYTIQVVKLPSSITSEIGKLCRGFLRGNSENHRRLHLVSWDKVMQPKHCGGLGVR